MNNINYIFLDTRQLPDSFDAADEEER